MNFSPPVAKGIVSAFDDVLKDMYKLSLICRMTSMQEEAPVEYKETVQMYNKITEDSIEDDCIKMVKLLKDFSVKEEDAAKYDKETPIKGKNSFESFN